MMHGAQQGETDLSFSLPSICAQQLETGITDVGLAPVAEIARQGLEIVPGVGITCLGPVRSILLFARTPWKNVRRLSADCGSRTSVQLARIILRERFGIEPEVNSQEPVLAQMLEEADAALVIGDPALRLDPQRIPFDCLDLGEEWFRLTSLPMVFAAWAGKPGLDLERLERLTRGSYGFGRQHIEKIIETQSRDRGIAHALVREYLTRHIRFEIGSEEQAGLAAFLELSRVSQSAVAQVAL